MTVAECEEKCKGQSLYIYLITAIELSILELDDTPTSEECPEGMVYQECGTACPITCDNKDDVLRPCTLQCVQGNGVNIFCKFLKNYQIAGTFSLSH